jgi:hypothetical protein
MAILVTAAAMAVFDVLAVAGVVPAALRPVVAAVCTAVVPMLLGLWGYQHHQTQLKQGVPSK